MSVFLKCEIKLPKRNDEDRVTLSLSFHYLSLVIVTSRYSSLYTLVKITEDS